MRAQKEQRCRAPAQHPRGRPAGTASAPREHFHSEEKPVHALGSGFTPVLPRMSSDCAEEVSLMGG